MQRRMLSKEEEATVGKDDLEVRREDQDKINKFSRLHQREMLLEEELKARAKDKEDLEEVSNELELADEDEKIPYKIGDAFIMLPLPEVQELLSKSTSKIEDKISATEEKLSNIRDDMNTLKVELYARFGKTVDGQSQQRARDISELDTEAEKNQYPTTPHQGEHKLQRGLRPTFKVSVDNPDQVIDSNHLQHDPTNAEQRNQRKKEHIACPEPDKSPTIIISFPRGDPENPYNWSTVRTRDTVQIWTRLIESQRRKIFVLSVGIVSVVNSTLGSSLPSGATEYLSDYFHVKSQAQLVLPISLFLVGYVFGPVIFAPLSESYGRRGVMVITFVFFTIFTMACAVAPNWPVFLVFRLLCGITASSAIAVVGGLFADIYDDPITRGRAFAFFMAATTCGPQLAPIISGFISVISWRWTFWVGLMIAGVSLVFLFFMPETYGPTILKHRAQKMRKETGNPNIFAPIELEKKGARQMITVTLTRPIRMIVFEAIVLFTCLYLSIAYAIFYLFFEAYPLIFQGIYHFNTGTAGLPFLAIGLGAFLSMIIFMYWDSSLARAKKANAHWAHVEEYRRLPLACIGGPLYVISLFWLGWTANPHIHWIVPILSGIPFGIGFMLIFMALINYVGDAYEVFAASAMAATSACRSIFGAVLPIAARPLYAGLGIAWASSLLGFLSLGMCVIPFAFIAYGDRIRANSKFCQELKERKKRGLDNDDDGEVSSPRDTIVVRDGMEEEGKGEV
ncbi:MAG: hypothetical protein Q9182_004430 [Xanthomendoza sp. 2 TL-2023]